ncbi:MULTISPECIES: MFS transporter [Streptacidiphilus]|uniref:MFS transporter n=1 Tax=Streptacidiphilus cavernicola TaxID=3342716 RepID=A0ABV6UIB0_9ACTN|nr:MFS transporter [Streptacidiphilus jeojiense]
MADGTQEQTERQRATTDTAPAESRLRRRLVLAAAVSQTGNWLTFLAVVVAVQEKYGSAASAGVFFAQTVPALLGARAVSDRIGGRHTYRAWAATQVVLALLSLTMCVGYRSLPYVYAFVALAMFLRAVANPLLFTLVTTSVSSAVRESTYTAVGAAGSLTLVLAPAVGGALSQALGVGLLFALDASSFLIGVAILLPRHFRHVPDQEPARSAPAGPRRLFSWAGRPQHTGPLLTRGMVVWFSFMLTGALLNAVEMPRFQQGLGFSAGQVGLALGCYGLGGLAALGVSTRRPTWTVPMNLMAALYAVGLVAWSFGSGPLPYLAFLALGCCAALVSGAMRSALSRLAARENVSQQGLWGWVNQIILFANLIMYSLAGILFLLRTPLWALLTALIATATLWAAASHLLMRPSSATGRILARGSEA